LRNKNGQVFEDDIVTVSTDFFCFVRKLVHRGDHAIDYVSLLGRPSTCRKIWV